MTVLSPAIGIQSGSHTAKAFRQLACALAGAEIQTFVNSVSAVDVGHGLVRSTHLTVTQRGAGVNMSVDVAKGTALVNGSSSLAQGIYAVTNDAVVNLAIATADAVNPRRDLVVIQVRDNTEDAGGSNDARLFVVTGTPAASPADPAIPAGCLVLARIAVAALASSITNANITALAGLARGSSWNQAWGVVGYAYTGGTDQAGIGAALTDITGLSVTFTAVAGRLYKTTLNVCALKLTTSDNTLFEIRDGASVTIRQRIEYLVGGAYATVAHSVIEAGLSGATTRKASAFSTTGTVTINNTNNRNGLIVVEDIGPA